MALPPIKTVRGKNHLWLLLNTGDHISKHIAAAGEWAPLEVALATSLLQGRTGCTVIDAGANLGGFTVPVAHLLMNQQGRVICFEPQRVVFQQLCANIFINRLDNCYPYNTALGEVAGSITIPELCLHESKNLGAFSIDAETRKNMELSVQARGQEFPNKYDTQKPEVTVQRNRLDDLKIKDVAFVKIDVEGQELEVIRGAVDTLEDTRFPPLIFEMWDGHSWYQEKAEATLDFVKFLGYEILKIGNEVLAQHDSHNFKLYIKNDGSGLRISRENN